MDYPDWDELGLECGVPVRITNNNPLVGGATGKICGFDGELAQIRLDEYKPEFDGYDDLKTGCVWFPPEEFEVINE